VVTFLLDFTESSDALQYLTEWRRPELSETVFLPFAGLIVFVVFGAFRGRILPRHVWLIAPFVMAGLSSVRAIPPAFLALIPLLAVSLSGLEIGSQGGLRARLALVFALVVLVLPLLLIEDGQLSEERFPVDAVAGLDATPTFHDDVIGGFLIWAEGPDRKVYIDDRAELYGNRMAEFVAVRRGEADWHSVFQRDGIGQALLPNDAYLVSELGESGWEAVYKDENFTLLRPGT
jgi:hypothetical protein